MISIQDKLAELASLDRPALARRWESAFGVPAPKSCQATLLRCALAWHVQGHDAGSDPKRGPPQQRNEGSAAVDRASKALRQAASAPSPLAASLTPGTRLLREWQGSTHHVTVTANGFEHRGQTWNSLSAIASAITGTRWSGPRFFGLRS